VKTKMVFQPKAPTFKGLVQNKTHDNKFENKGNITLWQQENAKSENKQPPFKGYIEIGNTKYNVSLWENLIIP
jgi:hypothetical protein